MADRVRHSLEDHTDSDVEAAHRAFTALVQGMRSFRTDIPGLGPAASS
jgi:hypothetical protein